MSFTNSHPSSRSRKNIQPEVADREPLLPEGKCLSLSIDPATKDIVELDDYRVFLKRNLKPLAAPADLFASINARLAAIDAEKV